MGIFHGWRRDFDGDRESSRDQSGNLRIKLRQSRGHDFRASSDSTAQLSDCVPCGCLGEAFLGIDVRDASPADRIRNTKIPILLIHSSADAVIPFPHARLLQQALAKNPNAEFWFHEQFAHGQWHPITEPGLETFFSNTSRRTCVRRTRMVLQQKRRSMVASRDSVAAFSREIEAGSGD